MEVFLPIAEVSVNIVAIISLSGIVGILSGLFGVGGGFLMTPFLIFLGVPPTYAVANEANNILATSVSGSTTHYLKKTLDYKMGLMIVVGGVFGTLLGIWTFTYFKGIGKIDIVISLAYMYILAIIGTAMLVEGLGEIDKARKKILVKKIIFESKNKLNAEIQYKKKEFEKKIEAEVRKTEQEIESLKEESLASITTISEEITSKIIEMVSGEPLNQSSVKAAVLESTKKNLGKYS